MQAQPVETLISNLSTEVTKIEVEGRSYPLTVNSHNRRNRNCYICDPITAYIDYAFDETRNLVKSPIVRGLTKALIHACSPVVVASKLDQQVQINNWLFSTNPMPALTRSAAQELRDSLTSHYPEHALVVRSLNDRADTQTLMILRDAGFQLLPARQVYIFQPDDRRPSSDMRRDLKLLSATGLMAVEGRDFTEEDYDQSAHLYRLLYIDKYTPLNPLYSGDFIGKMHLNQLISLKGLRCTTTRSLVGVTGFFENGRTLTQPIVGYDTSRPQREGLYRMMMAMSQEHARKNNLFFNMSAGAAAFKRLRQAEPVIEYTAVYTRHLSPLQRLAVTTMERVLTKFGIPLLQRFEL